MTEGLDDDGGRWAMACRARSGSTVRMGRSTTWARRSLHAATSWATPAGRSAQLAGVAKLPPGPVRVAAAMRPGQERRTSSSAQAPPAVLVQGGADGVGQVEQSSRRRTAA